MKKNVISKGKVLFFLVQFVFLSNFVLYLIQYLFHKQTHDLVFFIMYSVGFVTITICLFIEFFSDRKTYAIAFNDIYYHYGENIIETSKLLEIQHLKNRKIKKISINDLVEYRLIDNQYANQKIGLVKLDEIKTLIIFYKPKYKDDYKSSLLDVLIDDRNRNRESFAEMVPPPKLDNKYVYYSKSNIEAVVIEELNDSFQCITYYIEVSSTIPDLKNALEFCIPHWEIEYDYPVEEFDNFKDAEKCALNMVQLLNREKSEKS